MYTYALKSNIKDVTYIIFVYMPLCWACSCPANCVCPEGDSVQCTRFVPKDIPRATKSVNIINPKVNVTSELFAGQNWNNISQLTINCDREQDSYIGQIRLGSEAFKELSNLRALSVTNFDQFIGREMLPESFKGIEGLVSLNLEGNQYFDIDLIVSAIRDYLHNLEVIHLADVDSEKTVHINNNFLLAINNTRVQFLDISGLTFGFENIIIPFPSLQTLIWRRFSDLRRFFYNVSVLIPETLKTVDISEGTILLRFRHVKDSKLSPDLRPFRNIKVFKVNGIFKEVNILSGSYELHGSNSSSVTFQWEHLEMIYNGFEKLNFSISDQFPFMNILNVSHNRISFISTPILRSVPDLTILDLSYNDLTKMENKEEFSDLLTYLQKLKWISLRNNGLSKLPQTFFNNNLKLTVIDLSSNNLDQISFQINQLKNLSYLNLHNNRLRTISVDVLSDLQDILHLQKVNSGHKSFLLVNISNNPFICGCKSDLDANLENIIHFTALFGDSHVKCNFEDSQLTMTEVSRKAILKTCQRKQIIIIASVVVTITIIIGAVTVCLSKRILKRYRKKQHLLDLINLYKDPNREPNFLVFLSYSSADTSFVDKVVYPQLETKLQELLQTDKALVCNGDLHFQAGRRIEDEIVKAVESCKVVILLISKAFCSSPWCDYETMVSYYEKKPIILMLKEDVPVRTMPSVLRKLFKSYVRAVWKDIHGEMTLRPGLDKLCQSIINQTNI